MGPLISRKVWSLAKDVDLEVQSGILNKLHYFSPNLPVYEPMGTLKPPLHKHINTSGQKRWDYKLQQGLAGNKVNTNSSLLSPRGNAGVILLADNTK